MNFLSGAFATKRQAPDFRSEPNFTTQRSQWHLAPSTSTWARHVCTLHPRLRLGVRLGQKQISLQIDDGFSWGQDVSQVVAVAPPGGTPEMRRPGRGAAGRRIADGRPAPTATQLFQGAGPLRPTPRASTTTRELHIETLVRNISAIPPQHVHDTWLRSGGAGAQPDAIHQHRPRNAERHLLRQSVAPITSMQLRHFLQ